MSVVNGQAGRHEQCLHMEHVHVVNCCQSRHSTGAQTPSNFRSFIDNEGGSRSSKDVGDIEATCPIVRPIIQGG